MEHTDLEKYKLVEEPNLFRNRPAPIVIEYKKNNEEQINVQQSIQNAETKTELITERTSTMISNVTKIGFKMGKNRSL